MLDLGILFITPILGVFFTFFSIKNGKKPEEDVKNIIFNIAIAFAILNFVFSLFFVLNFDFSNASELQFSVSKLKMLKGFYLYSVGVDGLSLLFIVLTNFLTILCLISAKSSIKKRFKLYASLFLLLQSFCLGLFMVRGIIWFYIFFEAILIPMFFMIGIWGGNNRIYASYKFFIYTFFGSVFFLLGVIYVVSATGQTDILVITKILNSVQLSQNTERLLWLCFFISLAIKVPMFPFHTWLPDAHVEAPTSGSVILAGILIKIGGYGMLRFLLPMFPNASIFFSDFVIILSIIGVIYGSFIAIMQEDIKKMIAYSSIAHMGFVTAGIFSLNQNGISAAVFQMFSHGLVSGALFLSIGVLYERLHTREFAKFGGIAKKMPHFAIVLMVFTMASAGLPMTSGFVGEFMTIVAIYKISFYYALLIGLSIIFGALYMLYMYKNTMFGTAKNPEIATLSDITTSEKFSLYSLALLILVFGISPNLILQMVPKMAILF